MDIIAASLLVDRMVRGVASPLLSWSAAHLGVDKGAVERYLASALGMIRRGSVWTNDYCALRVCSVSGAGFPNVVLSLSTLMRYDHLPVLVCVVRPHGVSLHVMNTSCIDRVSHSAHRLSPTCIRGSFLGGDIYREVDGIPNDIQHVGALFTRHMRMGSLPACHALILRSLSRSGAPTPPPRLPRESDAFARVMASVDRAADWMAGRAYHEEWAALQDRVQGLHRDLWALSRMDNRQQRGHLMEALLTDGAPDHGLADLMVDGVDGCRWAIDVKTKILRPGVSSSPKGYNLDKVIDFLAEPDSVYSVWWVGVDPQSGAVYTSMDSMVSARLLDATRIQHHWSRKGGRGATQFVGYTPAWGDACGPVDPVSARTFLESVA